MYFYIPSTIIGRLTDKEKHDLYDYVGRLYKEGYDEGHSDGYREAIHDVKERILKVE